MEIVSKMIEIKNSIVFLYLKFGGYDNKDKKSILRQIKSFKTDDKAKSNKKEQIKGTER